ncbi:hypothetical protein CF327_g1080 [Tilletia walkeri]|nr:hypothetical protein CF327_g1080 [Tilletia walkeri]
MTTIPYDLDLPSLSLDPDAPTASSASVATSQPASGGGSRGSRPGGAGGGGAGSDSEDDDAAPDYRLLGKLLGNSTQSKFDPSDGGDSQPGSISRVRPTPEALAALGDKKIPAQASLPKRGEKDFEPTGFKGQRNALDDSRAAMFAAVGSERRPSKSPSVATWDPILQRAIVHSFKGILFQSMGLTTRLPQLDSPPAKIDANGKHWPRIISRIELTPEETLFLLERGVLECRLRLTINNHEAQERQRKGEYRLDERDEVLSVKRAFGVILGIDGCSKEAYGVYSYLRRLGYVVHRARDVDLIRSRAAEKGKAERARSADIDDDEEVGVEGIVADPERPLRLVTIWDILLYLPRRLFQLGRNVGAWVGGLARAAVLWLAGVVRRVVGSVSSKMFGRSTGLGAAKGSDGRGSGLLGIGGRTFSDFDSVFSELRIVPTGHDRPLPPRPQTTSIPPSPASNPPPFEPFFYAWRPAGQFRKSHPPPPEFRIAICNARQTKHIPSSFEFSGMFDKVPMPGTEAFDEEDAKLAAELVRINNASYGRAQSTKVRVPRRRHGYGHGERESGRERVVEEDVGGVLGYLIRAMKMARYLLELIGSRLFSHCLPGVGDGSRRHHPSTRGPGGRAPGGGGGMNPFLALKTGRRSVVVAVVDQGTTSLVRFGEAEFARWRMAGAER